MKKEHTTKAKDLLSEGYAPFKIVQLLKEDGVTEEEAATLVESLSNAVEKKSKKGKTDLVWRAILAGFAVTILCSTLWAVVALQTRYDFVFINLIIGGAIGYVMRSVSRDIPRRIIPIMAIVFAVFSIFLGDVIFHMVYWHEEFVIEAGKTPFLQYMLMKGFWEASWDIAANRNLMDILWMCLCGTVAYFFAK